MLTGRKLLLADDSVTIQKVVDLTFSDEGLKVITASDGQQALDKLEEDVPDIVLADVHMPQLNGYELCELIKQDDRFRHIPVMLLVGSFEPFDEAEARRVGADDYLTKPFQSIRTLIGKVHNLLSGEKAGLDEATTRKLTPPPEAEQANRSDPEFLERSTADTAPLPHVRAESETGVASRDISFADLGMDDELIETSPVSDYNSGVRNTAPRSTVQYSAADLHEAGIAQAVESPVALQETLSAYAPVPESDHAIPAYTAHPATRASELTSSDDALLDLGDVEPPAAMQEADDFFLDLLDESPRQPQMSSSSWIVTSSQSYGYERPVSAPAKTLETPPPIEVEVAPVTPQQTTFRAAATVEPVVESTATQETSSDQETAEFPPGEHLPEDHRVEDAAGAFNTSESEYAGLVDTSPQTGRITLEQLSPEVIEAIARRAVELLSERAVEQIAWEVVPDLAERIIRRRLEEEK